MKSTGVTNQNFTFVGTPNDGTISVSVDIDTNSLLGNPYPSSLNISQFINDNLSIIDGTLYFWEHTGEAKTSTLTEGHNIAGYQGGYSTRNATMGIAANAPTGGTDGLGNGTYTPPGTDVAIGQGFFVGAKATGTINFENSQRGHQIENGSGSVFLKSSKIKKTKTNEAKLPVIKFGFEYMNSSNVNIHRQIGISFKPENTFDFENGQDSFIYDLQQTDAYWEFPINTNKYAIAGIEEISDNLIFPIVFKTTGTSDIKLMIDEKENINRIIYLNDKITDQQYDLATPLNLNLIEGTYNDRFTITFGSDQSLGTEEIQNILNTVYYDSNTKQIIFILKDDSTNVKSAKLINILGKTVINWKSNSGNKLPVKNITNGVYILHIKTSLGENKTKIIIH